MVENDALQSMLKKLMGAAAYSLSPRNDIRKSEFNKGSNSQISSDNKDDSMDSKEEHKHAVLSDGDKNSSSSDSDSGPEMIVQQLDFHYKAEDRMGGTPKLGKDEPAS
jgi:hypothetical protein